MKKWLTVDKWLLEKLFAFGNQNKRLGRMLKAISSKAFVVFFTLYLVVGVYCLLKRGDFFIYYIAVPAAAWVFVRVIRVLVKRKRPYQTLKIPGLPVKEAYSFPSNHAASSLIISLTVSYILPPLGVGALLLAAFTGLGRIAAGLHYPSDILAGWLVACFGGVFYLLWV